VIFISSKRHSVAEEINVLVVPLCVLAQIIHSENVINMVMCIKYGINIFYAVGEHLLAEVNGSVYQNLCAAGF
jgi:hypothetical protein